MGRLQGKIAVVTGSSSGIGKAIALTFGREGARVVIAARRLELCEEVAKRIRDGGGEAMAAATDVTDEAHVERLMSETVRAYGGLDILVNNAGIGGRGRIAAMATRDFDAVMATNLRGTFLCSRAGLRIMHGQRRGLVINMSSIAGVQAWAGTGAYSASKFGIMGMTKAMADEARESGIKVSAICPGGVADELVDAPAETITRSGKISPYEVAETCLYLATLGPNTTVPEIILNRMGADW